MAGTVPISQASPLYTAALKARFDEMSEIKVNNFFRSFFTEEICKERYPIVEVRRGSEKVAVDVIRGHQGMRTSITKFDQKAWDTFYYKLYFDATIMECYYRAFGSTSFNLTAGAELVNGIAVENKANRDMIDRAIEIHCMNILNDGTCTSLRDGSIVDFKRQGGSIVNLAAGSLWTDAGVDPAVSIEAAGDWLRQKGKNSGADGYNIQAVFGSTAWLAFRGNAANSDKLKQINNRRDVLPPAIRDSTGAIYQMSYDCGSYIMDCYTYKDFYDKDNGDGTYTSTPYMDPKKVYFLPMEPIGKILYGATPQLINPGDSTLKLMAGKTILSDYLNAEEKYHKFYVESAPLPVPIKVDKMYTLKPVA